MSDRITPLPAGAGEPLAIMHRACFPDDPWDAEALARVMSLSGSFGFLAWRLAEPGGFILARDLGGEVEVLSFGVLPGLRRRGIGRGLLDAVAEEAVRRRAGSIVLEVAADNDPARRLYGDCGFRPVGRRPRYYRRAGSAADALILRKNLLAEP